MSQFHGKRRAALAAAVVAAAAVVTPVPASAQPGTASDALEEYNQLTREAEELNQNHLKAQEDLKAKRGELDKANADLAEATRLGDQARADEERFRGQVDLLTEASFEGARFNQLSALLVSDSQQDFLDRMSALGVLAADNDEALGRLSAAVDSAEQARAGAQDAQQRTARAAEEAAELADDISARKSAMDKQVADARAQYNALSAPQKAVLADKGDTSAVAVPSGVAGKALDFALAQRGKPYVFGSNGPDSWDCSSLTQAAYRHAGVSIPRTTYTQATVGRAVTRAQVQAGDLIIYYSGQSHVAMAVDGVRAVHASTEGVPVKIADIDSIGPISVIRRVVG
ncbi:cell wall-associated NlpC family hydrolase [Saccharothrix coeruleofusca]|uniref:C40 family peptidase n=1 Tax=Saccharothrix coeruleofusca TaxID=33919 RepID=UPI001AE51197|nr:C40 family peptidase [Saccharothrix coeruleofusca]MBP2337939.1 cell wall-associated NlpC family hydrolase [Saccharothrix coeruleofusca]